MKEAVFITGNQKKAEYLSKYFGHPIEHVKIDLEEIQSLDLREVVQHKMLQAYAEVKRPAKVRKDFEILTKYVEYRDGIYSSG